MTKSSKLASGSPGPSPAYQLDREVGSGATSTVWRALRGDGEVVALKIGRSATDTPQLAVEALHASLALSPRLPELIDLGLAVIAKGRARPLDDGKSAAEAVPYLALRWVDGELLSAASAVPPDEAMALALATARDVGEALADLHGVGLSHGDVKPANILREPNGRLSLIDLGLAGPAGGVAVRGATPRYLGSGDRQLGDGRARDLLALGLLLTELVSAEIRDAAEPLGLARQRSVPAPLATLTGALLAPEPGARPAARWVNDLAAAASQGGTDHRASQRERDRRSLRASYLRLRRRELVGATGVEGPVAPWLVAAVSVPRRARAMCEAAGRPLPAPLASAATEKMGPLDAEQRKQWLAALVGSAALDWPSTALAEVDEPTLVGALTELARHKRPPLWSLADLEGALDGAGDDLAAGPDAPEPKPSAGPLDATAATELTLRVSQLPMDLGAAERVEQLGERAPMPLRLATADALRLAGHLGRARSLVLDLPGGGAVAADVLRRAGDVERARAVAGEQLASGDDPGHRARACLGLILLDEGKPDEAAALVADHASAATAEIAARVAIAREDRAAALAHAERGRALATTAEEHARLAGVEAYVLQLGHAPGARDRFQVAVAHAVRAGAVLEEATYRIGEASACVDLGQLEAAIDTARRAALLWDEVLRRPAMAARAWLARAGAYASIDARHEATYAAEQACERAELSADSRAVAYALWAIADASRAGDEAAALAARRAADLLGEELDDDGLRAAARVQRHAPDQLTNRRRHRADELARGRSARAAFARLDWWAARAETATAALAAGQGNPTDGQRVLTELAALADADAPVWTRGKAMHAACRLAAALGDTETLPRLDAARRRAATPVLTAASEGLAEQARACPWLGRHAAAETAAVDAEQALDLQKLVRTLSERRNLSALLDQVIDVLLLWTGAERGLLLMHEADGQLQPRSARHLSQDDLQGDQLTVSSSLAQRALDTGEPVVAVDAMEELSQRYSSVHALKLRSVLVLPLVAHGEVLGVAYLDDRIRRGAFGDKEIRWAQAVAPLAALAIADARTQADLRSAVARAEEASQKLEQSLARKETALDVAERELARAVGSQDTRFRYDDIVGQSEPMRRLLSLVDRVATSDVPVLLRGESGSGKELVARAIHRGSPRSSQAFVGESCGALPETLLESTLFGHVKGAFTGAHRPRSGLFEAADQGTLFLDEVGEMSLGMQTKLLRVLEDSIVRPVGATRARKVDVRIIAATHRDLEQMVAEGTFREDLYYRINVITVRIPPLRERASDIPLLVDHLMAKHAPGRDVVVSAAARSRLMAFPWPGNVRQLENEVRRALLLSDDRIDVEHLSVPGEDERDAPDLGLNVRARIDHLETELVTQALERTGGNQTQAAKLLGLSRYGLHKMMKRLGLSAR